MTKPYRRGPQAKVPKLKIKQCLKCHEDMDAKIKSDICKVCTEEMRMAGVPDPVDLGDQTCWFDGDEHKIHHCMNRITTAKGHAAHGRAVTLPHCLKCGSSPETTPLPPKREYDEEETVLCDICHNPFTRRAKSQQSKTCKVCVNDKQRDSNRLSMKRAKAAKEGKSELITELIKNEISGNLYHLQHTSTK